MSGCAALKAAPGLLPAVAARTERVRCTARPAAAGNAAGALLPATKPPLRASFGSLPSLGASLSSPPSAAQRAQASSVLHRSRLISVDQDPDTSRRDRGWLAEGESELTERCM